MGITVVCDWEGLAEEESSYLATCYKWKERVQGHVISIQKKM